MKIHAIRHVPYEELGFIESWIDEMQHELSYTLAFKDPSYPPQDSFDALVIMGGPMSANDEDKHGWLKKEKQFILETINSGKPVLGICLGSQLIASALGARVYPNAKKEIGWYPVHKTFEMHSWFPEFDEQDQITLLHWHGDIFDLPDGAVRLFYSEATPNQGFTFNENVLALQFHPEMKKENISAIIEKTRTEIIQDDYVMSPEDILAGYEKYAMTGKKILFEMLDYHFG